MLVQIDYVLQFETSFHCGTGVTAGLVDRTVARDANHKLYIPASTFKGILRRHCEQLCHFYLPNMPNTSPHNAYETLVQFGKAPTLISRIFGSALYPGALRFDDACQEAEAYHIYKDIQTTVLAQSRIDRLTRTAVDGALYTSEFGTSYLVFEGKIKGQLHCTPIEELSTIIPGKDEYKLTPTYSLLLLLASLLMIEQLGGNKSTGKGQCACKITRVLLDRSPCPEEYWRSWIERLEVVSTYVPSEGV